MNHLWTRTLLITALSVAAVTGCKKREEAVAPAATPPEAPAAPTAATPAAAPTVSITAVDLGKAVDANNKVAAPMTTFAPQDTVYASVTTSTSDPAATVPARIGAKWTFEDGQTVKEDPAVEVQATQGGTTAFSISKPDGFPAGKYKVEISLDGNTVQSREFVVKK